MLKHQEIIEKLTTEQKLALLADIFSWKKESEDADFCGIAVSSIKELNKGEEDRYPSFEALANSWDSSLLTSVAETIVARAKKRGVNLLQLPESNVKLLPYSKGFTEDPFLSGTLSSLAVEAGIKGGVQTLISDPSLSKTDAWYSDEDIAPRTVREFFRKPFDIAFQNGAKIVKTALPNVEGSAGNANEEWLRETEKNAHVIYECKNTSERINFFLEGKNLCYGGSYAGLKEAYDKYTFLNKGFETGNVTLAEIEAERAAGGVIRPEELDSAIDDIVDFVQNYLSTDTRGKTTNDLDLSLKATEESIVLLKNADNLLPLAQGTKVAIIGDLAERSNNEGVESLASYVLRTLATYHLHYVGSARGYDIEKDRSDEYIQEAVTLAKNADVAIVAIGYDEERKRIADKNRTSKLPANQLALIDALAQTGVKIVAIVSGDGYPDMRFDEACKAVLFAPLDATKSATAVCNVLSGKTNPSGKLVFTCYEDTDNYFDTLRAYKENGRNKVGSFYGYRYYDTSGIKVKYPFGYGLSYANFVYSDLEIGENKVQFTVHNQSRVEGSEIIQVYVGKRDSALLRPKKELKSFLKVYLAPGKAKKITINLKGLDLSVWDEKRERFVTESGKYEIYVASSVNDVRLTGRFSAGETKIEKPKEKEKYSDYLQAYSNILSDGYTLETPVTQSEQSVEKKKRASFGWLMIMLCLDIVYGYFHVTGWTPRHWSVYVIGGLLTGIPLLLSIVFSAVHVSKKKKEQEKNMKEKMKKRLEFNVDDLADEIPYEELFEEEFAIAPIIEEKESETKEIIQKETRSVVEAPFDKELSLARVGEDFAFFAYKRGISADQMTIRRLFSSFAASRLIVLRSEDSELLSAFLPVLGEYFDSQITVDSFMGVNAENADILYNANGLSAAGRRIVGTNDHANKLRVMAFKDVKAASLQHCLFQIMGYLDQPLKESEIAVKNKLNATTDTFPLSEDMWFVLILAEGEDLTTIPKYVKDIASVTELSLQPGEKAKTKLEVKKKVAEDGIEGSETNEESTGVEVVESVVEREKTTVKHLTYSQFKKLIQYACRDYQMEELLWKRVDKLEEFIANCNDYRIENKQWQRMESFVSVYLAMGGNAEEALDCVIAQQLIYGMIPCVENSKKPLEEKFTYTLENIFGEGHVPVTLKAIRETGLGV